MPARCPYLGLVGNQRQSFVVASSRHRCYLQDQPERIASAHQSETCLRTAYRRCPRIVARATAGEPATAASLPRARRTSRASSPASREQVYPPGLPAWHAALQTAARAKTPRRTTSLTELLVMGLGVAILLAVLFIGYIVVYRLRVGPGMAAATQVAGAPELVTVEVLPTLAPTFTPTPSPTVPVSTSMAQPPTPIPEPTLPLPTAVIRPPAASPPTRLVIPRIAIDIPVLPVGVKTIREGSDTRVVWADVPYAGGFHQTSAYPGNPGNTVINGHRDIQGAVFRRLDRVQVGDEITLYVGTTAYPYRVTETLVVPETFASAEQRAANVRLIGHMPEERLTLVTCTPVGLATHRLLVIARPPEPLVPEMPEAGQDTQP
jgi:LPXTG-site transpeptidase (sortase) family protein